MVIERVCKPNSRALHDREAPRGRPTICTDPRDESIPTTAANRAARREGFYGAALIDRFSPRQRHVTVGVAIEKCECLHDNGNGDVKLRAFFMQQIPLLARLRM